MKAESDIQICTVCKMGKNDYLLDRTSVFCSYIDSLKDGKCSMFCSKQSDILNVEFSQSF